MYMYEIIPWALYLQHNKYSLSLTVLPFVVTFCDVEQNIPICGIISWLMPWLLVNINQAIVYALTFKWQTSPQLVSANHTRFSPEFTK